MIEWRDEGVVLAVRRHGETSVIVEVFTHGHGRHAGVVRGGISRRMTPHLQPGGQVAVTWKARLEDHLGAFAVEPLRSRAHVMADPMALAGLTAMTAMLSSLLPEREAHGYLYAESLALFDRIGTDPRWPLAYLHWEVSLLEELGFGLDLSACAVTGSPDDLIYVSPKTGRAVSRQGAGEWAGRLLPLPQCLLGQSSLDYAEIGEGLATTGHFLTKIAAELSDRPLPAARERFLDRLAKRAAQEAPPF
ncbi:DNA repair protein RecO [Celeribacter indicus]|uniref:DNA repair protein RecO n=1 Tax=Celeribacter indicus TaxID=1208324 RepID=A0A0B5DX47_9RHOB|nr:DNA repair protein RecO [Celeribacter indicus]AJE45326.1 DNA repair protein RecO [Celeribacter indicus]SDX19883.1 DNA replication and repair protein RecO [Celeribacter indicus]